jgi:hypothetical protein
LTVYPTAIRDPAVVRVTAKVTTKVTEKVTAKSAAM